MSLPEAGAITAVWSNIPKESEDDIRKWHNLEHTAERLEGPGYIACRRYNSEGGRGGRHKRLTVFEGIDLATFDSPYYLESRNNPTSWTQKSMGVIRDARRGVYELAVSCGERPRAEAPYIYTVRSDPAEGAEEDLIAWYEEEHFPRLCALEPVLRARLFRRAEKVSDIKTAETRMQGKQDGQQAFLAFLVMSSPDILGGDAWKEASAGTERSAEMLGKLEDLFREIWWWDFVRYAPGII
tara:strand:+ start:129 stop:848 length:720 start_codon:yes stop_codon:yes gene_type:complete